MTPLCRMLCTYWGLDPTLARHWWQAVARARWSLAQGWRRQVLLFDQGIAPTLAAPQALEAVERFLDTQAAPPQVIALVEALAQEGLLSAQDARFIENRVLAQVDRCGRWK